MKISDFLSPASAITEHRAIDKVQLLKELAARAAVTLHLSPDDVASAILKRERLGSTGMGNGVAIPHARIRDLKRPFGILARLTHPIEFDAVDDHPVDIVFMLLAPADPEGEQLNALACIARALRNPDLVSNLRHADDDAAAYQAIAAGEGGRLPTGATPSRPD